MNAHPRKPVGLDCPRPCGTTETILVVDDRRELCDVATLLLQRQGYHVLSAHDGEIAKKIARETTHIDLLLTDVEMPGLMGDELAEWFRVVRPGTAIVFMSGNPLQRRRLQPRHFIEKPFIRLDLLLQTVRAALDEHRAVYQLPSHSTSAAA